MKPSHRTFIACNTPYNNANIVLFGAPFDGTTSFRPGTRFAPTSIRNDSFAIESYSPYQDNDLATKKIADIGDLELPFGNTEKSLEKIEMTTKQILDDQKIPFVIGGEHLISLPVVKALTKKYPTLKIIHFDAHTDLRDEFFGESLSHATVMKKIYELTGLKKIYQFGIRSGLKSEFEFAEKYMTIERYTVHSVSDVVKLLGNDPIYVTVDLDILDPSVFPGTGTLEPGGITFNELLKALLLLKPLNIVGADVVELSPHYDQSGASTAVAIKIIRELLLIMST